MKRLITAAAAALCVLAPFGTQAMAVDYTVPAPPGPDFAVPTSVEYVYTADGGAMENVNKSKDSVLLPPDFGVGGIYPLNAFGATTDVNTSVSALGVGRVIYPGSVTASTTKKTVAYTGLNGSLKYSDGSIGTLSIPALGLTVGIYEGTDNASLAKGAGHFSETSVWDGNVALAAHNRGVNNYFGQLHTLSVGDTVTFMTKLGERTYAVSCVEKVSETDRSALASSGDNMITLYTCVRDERDFRWCVRAVEIGGEYGS